MHPERAKDPHLLRHAELHGTRDRQEDGVLRATDRYLCLWRAALRLLLRPVPIQRIERQGVVLEDNDGRPQDPGLRADRAAEDHRALYAGVS